MKQGGQSYVNSTHNGRVQLFCLVAENACRSFEDDSYFLSIPQAVEKTSGLYSPTLSPRLKHHRRSSSSCHAVDIRLSNDILQYKGANKWKALVSKKTSWNELSHKPFALTSSLASSSLLADRGRCSPVIFCNSGSA